MSYWKINQDECCSVAVRGTCNPPLFSEEFFSDPFCCVCFPAAGLLQMQQVLQEVPGPRRARGALRLRPLIWPATGDFSRHRHRLMRWANGEPWTINDAEPQSRCFWTSGGWHHARECGQSVGEGPEAVGAGRPGGRPAGRSFPVWEQRRQTQEQILVEKLQGSNQMLLLSLTNKVVKNNNAFFTSINF